MATKRLIDVRRLTYSKVIGIPDATGLVTVMFAGARHLAQVRMENRKPVLTYDDRYQRAYEGMSTGTHDQLRAQEAADQAATAALDVVPEFKPIRHQSADGSQWSIQMRVMAFGKPELVATVYAHPRVANDRYVLHVEVPLDDATKPIQVPDAAVQRLRAIVAGAIEAMLTQQGYHAIQPH